MTAGHPISEAVMTSDPPPWWRVKKKNALFYNGMARGDHRGSMAVATSLCVDTVEGALEVDEQFRHIHAHVKTLTARSTSTPSTAIWPPRAPRCSGPPAQAATAPATTTRATTTPTPTPNLLLPLSVVGTDPVVANAGVVHAPAMVD